MFRLFCRWALVARFVVAPAWLVTAPVMAQEAPPPTTAPAHRLPFGSSGHALELAVGVAEGAGAARPGAVTVVVAESPSWLTFDAASAPAVVPEAGGEAVARLAFGVSATAPVAVPGEIVLHVVDVSGAVVADHTVRVEAEAPSELALSPPRPNPSAGAATLTYAVPEAGRVRLPVFDALGREVFTLADSEAAPGGYEVRIPAGRLSAGVYAVRLRAGREARTVRLTVVR